VTILDRLTAPSTARIPTPRPAPTLGAPPPSGQGPPVRPAAAQSDRRFRTLLLVALAGLAVLVAVRLNPVAALAALGTGFFNVAGGGGAIVGFLALTAVGIPTLTAHATGQAVTPASFLAMAGQVRRFWPGWPLLVTGGVGTVVGVVILKLTPPATVGLVAPGFLVLAGLLVLFQGAVRRRIHRIGWELRPRAAIALTFGVGVYAGIIGVGTGTLALVVLGLTPRYATAELQQLILTRNVLLLGMAAVVSIVFIPTGLVSWPLAAVLAVPGAAGGWIGLRLIHRLPVPVLRASIAATAGAGAVWMWLR
jgi:uncharacterized membrane protein YfcA